MKIKIYPSSSHFPPADCALKTNAFNENGIMTIADEASNEAEKSLVSKLAKNVRGNFARRKQL